MATADEYDFSPLVDTSPARATVADLVERAPLHLKADGLASDRLLGTLVHRLLQRVGVQPDLEAGMVRQCALRTLDPEAIAAVTADPEAAAAWFDRVRETYRVIAAHPELRALLEDGEPLHEVPFTMLDEGGIVRGTIDCLVRNGDRVTVLEFKTGRAREEHRVQLALYRRAAERIFPDAIIDARLIYAGQPARA